MTTQINAGNIKQLRAALQAKLDEFARENGLVVGGFNIKYLDDSFSIPKLNFAVKTAGNTTPEGEKAVDPRFKIDLQRSGWKHGLTVDMIGKIVVLPSRAGLTKCEFLGMRASKAVFKSHADGKVYLYNAEVAAKYLKA